MCIPSPNFFTGFTFFSFPSLCRALAADTLSLCPALPPSHSVRGIPQPGRGGGAVGAGTPGALFSRVPPRTFPPTKWGRRKVARANKVSLQSPQMSHSLGCWSPLFARKLESDCSRYVGNALASLL